MNDHAYSRLCNSCTEFNLSTKSYLKLYVKPSEPIIISNKPLGNKINFIPQISKDPEILKNLEISERMKIWGLKLKNKYLANSRISVRVTENETDCMKEKNSNCTRASLVASLNSIKVILHV